MTPRTKAKPTSSNPPSPIQDATPSGVGSFQQVNAPSSGSDVFTAYQSELSEYKVSLDRATEEESVLQARLTEMAAYADQQFNYLENTTHHEMTSMAQQLQALNSELLAAQQEDEGATYRIEELERYRTMSNEAASHLEFRYSQLRSEFNEQMGQANAIMVHVGTDANAHINQLRLELENAEMNAKQEALAVGYANDQTCALHIEMLEIANQNQTMKSTMSLNIRRLETELDSADAKREDIMRELRSDLRSEHNRYSECEHHLALEESQLQLQVIRNEGLQSQLATSESRYSEELTSKVSGMRDMRIMELRSELHMKQSLLDRMQQQLTESKNQYHELSCQQARHASPSVSPSHGIYYEMYNQLRCEYEKAMKSKDDVDILLRRTRAELIDNEALLKTYQSSYDSLGKKYQDALGRIDFMSTNPNTSSNLFDTLHNEISDRDEAINRLNTEVATQEESLNRAQRDASKAISMLNDRRLIIKGATDYSIPESHLTEMHHLVSERQTEVEEMSSTIAALKLENQAASSSAQNMQAIMYGSSNNAFPRNECEEKCAKLKAELEEMKQEKKSEVNALRDELTKMEERKDYYKNNFSQAEDRANDEEQEFRAEAEAFEKLRNEYNANVIELENLEKDKSKSSISQREAEKINLQPWPKTTELSSWKGSVVHEVCVASGDRHYEDWKAWLAPCLADQPDLETLAKAPEVRFQSIDAKLSNALRKVIDNAGDKSMQVKYDMSMKNQMYGKSGDFIKGRELFAMILISFKSPDHTEVLYNSHHLYVFSYYGDDQLEAFYNKWLDIIYNMKHDDRPSVNSLRDTLFRKIEHSKLMHFDISRYRTFDEGHPEKTYDFLLNMIKGYIARGKQERLLKDRERAVKMSLSSSKTTPALEDDVKAAAPTKTKKEDAAAASSAGDPPKGKPKAKAKSEAASVLPTPSPKSHADKNKKGKGKGGKGRSSSPTDKKKIFCNYFFNKGGCNKGDKCLYSHSQKVYDAKMKDKKGRSRSRDSSGRKSKGSSSSAGPKKKVCWQWQKGTCTFGSKCKFLHADQSPSASSERTSNKDKKKKAVPITIDSFFDSDTEDAKDYSSPRIASAKKSSDVRKITFDLEPEIHKIPIKDYPEGMPKRIYRDPNKPYVFRKIEDLTDDQSKSDSTLGQTRARAKAIIMSRTGFHRDVDEVRIIIGPKFDMLIKLDNDKEDLIFLEELIEHEAERSLKKSKNLMCISLPVQAKDRRFILDSGSGHDLISARKAERMNLKKRVCDPIMFHTANGSTATQTEAEIDLGTFDEISQAYVLDDTPSVMSLGKRCMEEGYSFVWPSGKMPFMITKNGERIDLTIHDNIPYIDLGTYECTPYECQQTSKIHDLLEHFQESIDNFDDLDEIGRTSRRVYLDGESGFEVSNDGQDDSQHVKKLKVKKKRKAGNRRRKTASPGEEIPSDDEGYAPGTPYDGPPGGEETDLEDEGHGAPEEVAEGDEDDIEIDVVEGESRVAKRGTLKREANSLNHKLTHRYKNPYCDSCIRAKMKHFKTRRGSYKRELKKFGDLITFDAVDTSKVHDDVLVLEKEVLVVRDCFTGIIGAYPSDRMTKDDVVRAVKQFIGAKKVRQAYSDHAPQFIEAMNEMKIPIDHSLPGRPQTNSIAERTNQFILTATSTCLLEAGLPPCFWRTAILCVCHLLNVEPNDDELSAWCKLHGTDFAGKLIPYGARVNYKPPKTREAGQLHKFGPDSIPGVFAGYHIGPGMHWSRQYKVWPLSEFVHQNLGDDASKPEHRLLKPHLTEKVEMVTPLTFPCKQEYERVNTTLEGMKEKELLDGDPSKRPRDDDDEDDEQEEDDDELDDGDDGGPGPSGGKASKKPLEASEGIFDDKDPEEMTLQELIDAQPDHWKSGKAGDGKVYLNDDGEKVKLNVKGNPYKIGEDGRRLFKTSLRPKGTYSPEEWRKLSQSDRNVILKAEKKKLEKKEADEKNKRKIEEVKKKSLKKEKKDSKKDKGMSKSKDDDEKDDEGGQDDPHSKSKKSDAGVGEVMKNKVTLPITCTSAYLDMYDIVDDDDIHGKRYIDCRKIRRSADASPCSDASTDVPDDEEYLTEWDEWSEVEKGRGPKASWSGEVWNTLSGVISKSSTATPGESTMIKNGKCVNVKNMKNTTTDDDDDFIAFPTMPCTSAPSNIHRTKVPPGGLGGKLFNAMVSRPVGRAEIESNPKAKEAMLKEWKGLRDQEVFDFSMVREYDDVVAEAKKNKKEVHMARVHGICVEKNYQLPEGNPGRKFKGRGVLLGNQVKNQHWEAAFFQDLGNSPASFEASRWADFFGCLPGHSVKLADAIQAYIQAKLKGPLCWVELPTDAWPPEIQYWKFRRPVVRLDKALYGHPDSGTMWEQHCDKKVQEIGFKPIGEEWPSMYFHDELKLLLVIYVDDLKLAGPSENLAKGWEMLRTVLRIEPETDLGLYLGCVLSQGETQLHNGKKVKTITYNMEGLLKLSVEKYLDIIGKDTKLKKVSTPSLPEETKCSPYRAPSDGKRKVECPWCAHSFDPEMSALNETVNSRPGQDSETPNRGNLAPHAASVLMKLLYAARIARFDLLRSINALARNVTKWTKDDDARLHHLMCYVNSTLSLKMIGWVGDKIEDLSLGLFADADFAGCAQSLRSTSGSHLQVQGKFTRFPLAGGSKRQGCVSHSTPEAEIVAADTALRTLGIPALSLWKVLAKVFPQLLFHDDNQGMIGVVRSGRNPTMRHLERTHGISIASMHEHFQKDHFVLIYEITAKMAADIHTKGFRNPMAWKKACMLINLLEPQDLQSKEVLDMLQPSTDVDMTTRQVFQSKTEDIPNFPYTETPILPKEVYRKGLTSKEKLQYLPGMDPIFVVKQPVFYRPKPPGLMVPPDVLRSTWILLNGTWTKVEHRASPPEQAVRFDKWVERACFQYHSPNKQPLIPDTVPQSTSTTSTQRVSSSTYAHAQTAHSSSHRDSGVSTRNSRVKHPADSPMLMFSVDALFLDAQTSPSQHPKPIHQCLQPATRVINTLMRLVHGGSEGWHSHSTGACQKHPEISDNIPHVSPTRKSQGLSKKNEDYWQWEGEETLIRIHKTPRRQNFVPQDCEDCPCDHRIICDERETEQKFKTNTRVIKDTWRFKGDNNETTNKLNEFWTGRSTFKVLANAEVIDSDKSYKVNQGVITLCTHCSELNTIPITDVFVPYQYHIEVGKHEVDHPKVSVILWRDRKNRTLEFQLSKSPCDLMTSKFAKFSLAINLIEVPRDVPCFVLLCSEERNWFTFLQNKMQDEMKFHVVPITEDDDMLSPYGICKARRCLRTKLDSVFFAGPCTGGSPWNRINRWVSEATTQLIEAKKQIFWAMWEVFTSVLCELINMGSPALLELPRGCDYWKDRRMTDLVEGTVSHEHKFDGCMYGLKSQFQETPKPIKKPWKIVTWGVSFPKLRRKCDRRHDHAECAGRETRITQVYTKWIAKIIMKGINEHVIKNSPFVNVKVRKQWKIIAPDDDWLSEMSRDSENVRSHPIKLVTATACAVRGPDAIDLSFERSLLHWYLSRSTSPLTRSSWSSTFLWHLLSGFNDNLLFRDQRSVQLLELIGALSHCHLSVHTEPLKITMTEGVDLKSLGQFSSKRITIAQTILKETYEKVITARTPPPFRDTRDAGPRLLSSEDVVNQWIRFGMPPVIVYSAYFANTRYTNEATGEALELAYKILQRSQDSEKECLGWEFVSRGSRFVKVFTSKCPYEDNMMGLLMDEGIHSRLDELWIVLTKGHFPEPFDDVHNAAFAEAKIRDMKQRYRGTPSFNTEPSATSWLAVTRTAEYFKVMDELAKVNPRSPSDNENYFATMRQMVETHIKLLGFSLRYHNQHNPQDLIILQDVMRDVVDFETERPKGRSAAQNHFLCLLTLGSTIERHKTVLEEMEILPD